MIIKLYDCIAQNRMNRTKPHCSFIWFSFELCVTYAVCSFELCAAYAVCSFKHYAAYAVCSFELYAAYVVLFCGSVFVQNRKNRTTALYGSVLNFGRLMRFVVLSSVRHMQF